MRIDCAHLHRDCVHCCGLCCTAFQFRGRAGCFDAKPAGVPCVHLDENNRCAVYAQREGLNLSWCLSFDCFGAGPAALRRMGGQSWRDAPDGGAVLFQVFSQLLPLHQLEWYLVQALEAAQTPRFRAHLTELRQVNLQLQKLSIPELLTLDVESHRTQVSTALRQLTTFHCPHKVPAHGNCVGRRFLGIDLREHDCSLALFQEADLRGCDLTGTSFLGADLTGADLSGADLSHALFLTQNQLNTARGSASTLLPAELERPPHWR